MPVSSPPRPLPFPLKMMGKTDCDNYTLDDMFVSGAAQREGEGREEERMRNRAVGESRQLAASMEKCRHCFSSPELQKHLVVALGSKVSGLTLWVIIKVNSVVVVIELHYIFQVYLSLPAGVSMAEGHCLICPLQHHCCATGLDEDVWAEMQVGQKMSHSLKVLVTLYLTLHLRLCNKL